VREMGSRRKEFCFFIETTRPFIDGCSARHLIV